MAAEADGVNLYFRGVILHSLIKRHWQVVQVCKGIVYRGVGWRPSSDQARDLDAVLTAPPRSLRQTERMKARRCLARYGRSDGGD